MFPLPFLTTMHEMPTTPEILSIAHYLVYMAQKEPAQCINAMGDLLPTPFNGPKSSPTLHGRLSDNTYSVPEMHPWTLTTTPPWCWFCYASQIVTTSGQVSPFIWVERAIDSVMFWLCLTTLSRGE